MQQTIQANDATSSEAEDLSDAYLNMTRLELMEELIEREIRIQELIEENIFLTNELIRKNNEILDLNNQIIGLNNLLIDKNNVIQDLNNRILDLSQVRLPKWYIELSGGYLFSTDMNSVQHGGLVQGFFNFKLFHGLYIFSGIEYQIGINMLTIPLGFKYILY